MGHRIQSPENCKTWDHGVGDSGRCLSSQEGKSPGGSHLSGKMVFRGQRASTLPAGHIVNKATEAQTRAQFQLLLPILGTAQRAGRRD